MRNRDETGKSEDFVPKKPDETFKAMVAEKRPKVEYYHSTLGDKLLHFKRIDLL
jgi:hypothetical protein